MLIVQSYRVTLVLDDMSAHFLDGTLALDFRPSDGTEMALIALTDNLHRQLDQRRSVLLILLDLTAALNMVNHNLLTNCQHKSLWSCLEVGFLRVAKRQWHLGRECLQSIPQYVGLLWGNSFLCVAEHLYVPTHPDSAVFWAGNVIGILMTVISVDGQLAGTAPAAPSEPSEALVELFKLS